MTIKKEAPKQEPSEEQNGATVPSVEKRLIAASVQWAEEMARKG
jgi:hypothetical protein